jgi:DNA replicative helicase MCM subunit Mcm2 (Cdc46/Mcm family)
MIAKPFTMPFTSAQPQRQSSSKKRNTSESLSDAEQPKKKKQKVDRDSQKPSDIQKLMKLDDDADIYLLIRVLILSLTC